MRHQKGSICLRSGSFYVRAYQGGKQKNFFLVRRDERHHSAKCKAVLKLKDELMLKINSEGKSSSAMDVETFWTGTYLPYVQSNLRASSVGSYERLWVQHLRNHLGSVQLNEYTTVMGSQFLTRLSKTLGRRSLAHIRSLMSGIFSHALNLGLINHQPIHDLKILGKVRPPEETDHYTLEEIEDAITALIDHTDAQLVLALGFFMALRPSEIMGLQWGDIDSDFIHIRRAVVDGVVGPTKTIESQSSLPLIEPVIRLLQLWSQKSAPRVWVFENRKGGPIDLHNMVNRVIKPVLGSKYKSLYCLRRGGATVMTALMGNPLAAAQMLRHRNISVTMQNYIKADRSELAKGMKMLEAAKKS